MVPIRPLPWSDPLPPSESLPKMMPRPSGENAASPSPYRKAVLAVADGRIITAKDSLPDNLPGHGEAFHPAVPITLDTVAGNTITIDLGGGQFAYYMHLQPGSLRVKAGDLVRRGQVLARVGSRQFRNPCRSRTKV